MNTTNTRDHDIIAFAQVWAPFGGGNAEDIFVRFGIPPRRYFARLAAILENSEPAGINPHQLRVMRDVCGARLSRHGNTLRT